MKKLKALSFFSGAMGMDIGLERAGIDVVLAEIRGRGEKV